VILLPLLQTSGITVMHHMPGTAFYEKLEERIQGLKKKDDKW
jgi:hypothetical protein